jgi:hypothetical protein
MNTNTNTNTINYNTPTLSSSAVLVTLSMGVWGTLKKDKKSAEKIAADNNASAKAIKTKKDLLPDCDELKEITSFTADTRRWFNSISFVWNDNGQRLMPMSVYTDFVTECNAKEAEFWTLVDTLMASYAQRRYNAQVQLGDLYDPNDYPDTASVRAKFKFSVDYAPVPESGHFVVDLQGQAKAELVEQFNRASQSKLAASLADVCEEFRKCLTEVITKVDGKNEVGKQTRIHETFIPNIRKVIERVRLATSTCFEDNAELKAAVDGFESLMKNVSVDALKTNETARIQVREGVNDLLSKFDF